MSGLTAVEGSPRPPAPPPAAGPEALGSPVEKQVGDLKLRQIARREHLIFRPQPLGDLTDRGAAQQAAAGGIGKHRLNVAGRQLARIHLHRQSLQLLVASLREQAYDFARAGCHRDDILGAAGRLPGSLWPGRAEFCVAQAGQRIDSGLATVGKPANVG